MNIREVEIPNNVQEPVMCHRFTIKQCKGLRVTLNGPSGCHDLE